ncbi:MAG: sugar-transfer associated ATP-grasp domain-containing protein [Candidatus Dojkabacteria bacterium]
MRNLSLLFKNRKKVLGRNERQLVFIRQNNKRRSVKIADDKTLSKKILKKNNIPVPEQIAVIKSKRDLEKFNFDSLPSSFVVKPVMGVRGNGVDIFYNRDKEGRWIRADGTKASLADIKGLCIDIIDGKFSLFNQSDVVLIEERVKAHKDFKYYTYKGTPDVRVIVYNKIPIMSYIRLPTKESNGKANLDLGGIGAGIDMAVGKTTNAIIGKATPVEYIPGTNLRISGLKIPNWDQILKYSVEASMATGLGFGAIDFLIDREKGPLIVELNARPGLSIQLSNNDGLRWRLKKAQGIKVKTVEQGVRLGKDLFGGEIEEEIETISGKKMIGITENVTLYSLDGKYSEVIKAKIDTGADSTSIDTELARRLGYGDVIDELINKQIPENFDKDEGKERMRILDEELKPKFDYLTDIRLISSSHGMSLRPSVKLSIEIDTYKYETYANIFDRSGLDYKMIVGRKSLYKFLIDPSKK